jgi:hypothetical protein
MFSRGKHPYIQLDDSFLHNSTNPDYDTSNATETDIPLRDLSNVPTTIKRSSYKSLATPDYKLDQHLDSPLPSPGLSRPTSDIYKPLPSSPFVRWSGWHFAAGTGCAAIVFVFICNVALLGWAIQKPPSRTHNKLLYEGDCGEMKTIDTWSHFGINVLSTLILGASNYAMQVLVAPTRDDIDRAHPQGR